MAAHRIPQTADGAAHCLFVFDKSGNCKFYREWDRPRNLLKDQPDEDEKLVFGMLFSFKQLCCQMSPDRFVQATTCTKLPPALLWFTEKRRMDAAFIAQQHTTYIIWRQ